MQMQYTAKLHTAALYALLGLTFIGVGVAQNLPFKAELQFHPQTGCAGQVISTVNATDGHCTFTMILLGIYPGADTLQFPSGATIPSSAQSIQFFTNNHHEL
jgi:hypothetical protein